MSVLAPSKEKQRLLLLANHLIMLLEVKSDLLVVLICLFLFRTGVKKDSAGMAGMRPSTILNSVPIMISKVITSGSDLLRYEGQPKSPVT